MLKRLILLVFVLGHLAFAQVAKVELNMNRNELMLLLQRDVFSRDYLPAAMTVDGSVYSTAKIRFKGSTTPYYPKRPFRIKVDKKTSPPSLFSGMHQMNFNAMYTDKSFMREKIVWTIFNMMSGLGPKEHGYVNLFVNGTDLGIYLLLEHIDEEFLKLNNRAIGDIYEAEEYKAAGDLKPLSDALLKKTYEKHVGDENDYESLKLLIEKVNNTPDAEFASAMKELFDMKTVYDWFVLNTLTMQGDTWVKNYYLYEDPGKQSQRWSIIPWDYDMSFGRDGDAKLPYPQELLNDLFAYSYEPLAGPPNVLKDRILRDPVLLAEYKQRLTEVLQNIFTEENLYPMIDKLTSELDELAEREPIQWGTHKDFTDQADALKYFVSARRNYLFSGYLNHSTGENDEATVQVTSTGIPYDFADADGKLVGTMVFSSISGLKNITVHAYPSKIPAGFEDGKCIHRYVEVIPDPPSATFSATLKWEYLHGDEFSETGSAVTGDNGLACYNYAGGSWQKVDAYVNSFANYVTVSNVNESNTGEGRYFALKIPDENTYNWIKDNNLYWNRWYEIKFSSSGTGFIAGDDGIVLVSGDGGTSWKEHYTGYHAQLRTISPAGGTNVIAAGMFGFIFRSTNNGDSWNEVNSGFTYNINKTDFSGTSGYAACDKGTILISRTVGASWSQKQVSDSKNLYSVCTLDENTVLVGGDKGALYKSTDGGTSWNIINSGTAQRINSLCRGEDGRIWGACSNGTVISSIDNGQNWIVTELLPGCDFYAISCDANTVYACGSKGVIYRSSDGANWIEDVNHYSNDIMSVLLRSGRGLAVGNMGLILRKQ